MVTAVITTHNRKELLGRAIQSVLSQTYKDIELIVVSDGSTDGTDEMMKQYEGDDRVKYITYYPGKGGNYARNTGIKAAKGEYVAFLDDDDEWLPTKIEEQMKEISTDDSIGIVYTGTNVIYVDYNVRYLSIPFASGNLASKILWANCIGSTTTVMIKKKVLDKTGMFDENLPALQDYDLWIRICQIANVGVVSKALVNYYNYNNGNQVSSNLNKYEKAFMYINTKYENLYNQFTEQEKLFHLSDIKIALGERNLRNGKKNEARKFFIESLKIKMQIKAIVAYLSSFIPYKFLLKYKAVKTNSKENCKNSIKR